MWGGIWLALDSTQDLSDPLMDPRAVSHNSEETGSYKLESYRNLASTSGGGVKRPLQLCDNFNVQASTSWVNYGCRDFAARLKSLCGDDGAAVVFSFLLTKLGLIRLASSNRVRWTKFNFALTRRVLSVPRYTLTRCQTT